jgi:hypothetical protein
MTAPAWDETELLALFARVCDGLADAAEVERLSERLVSDPRARQLWLEYVSVHGRVGQILEPTAALVDWPQVFSADRSVLEFTSVGEQEASGGEATGTELAPQPGRAVAWALAISRFARRYPVISCTAAAVVVALGITTLWFITLPERGPRLANGASDPKFVARLSNAFKAQWSNGQIGGTIGSHLQAGHPYRLKSGMAEITFRSGARIVLEGPADFRIVSENSGKLYAGKLTANVPQKAVGFMVETDRGRVIDLGTRFAVDAARNSVTVHCFRGEVAFEAPRYYPVRLLSGEAVEHNGRSQVRVAANAAAFVHDLRLRGELQRDPRGLVIDSRFSNNAALGKAVTQSSTESSYTADLAVDGDPTNFTHTAVGDANAWLMVDLGELHDIDAIVLHNRDNCCGNRLRDVVVEILDEDGQRMVFASAKLNENNQSASPPLIAIGMPEVTGDVVRGRYVRIRRVATPGDSGNMHEQANLRVLSLGEVQIFATPAAPQAAAGAANGGRPNGNT